MTDRGDQGRKNMLHIRHIESVEPADAPVTEMVLSDRLIALAQDADRAGFRGAAGSLVRLACAVFDEVGATRH
jgi:hypothetical protein